MNSDSLIRGIQSSKKCCVTMLIRIRPNPVKSKSNSSQILSNVGITFGAPPVEREGMRKLKLVKNMLTVGTWSVQTL